MSNFLKLLFLMLFCFQHMNGQQITGTVQDRATDLRLENVSVINKSSNQRTHTNAKGEFNIQGSANQLLIFYQPGYKPDTLFLVDLKPVKRYLVLNNIMLKTVQIKAGAFNPKVEYRDVYRDANAIRLSQNHPFTFYPSRYFSKEGKYARRFKRRLEQEKIERKIDARFNETAVQALTPLNGKELDCFMVLYRPTLKELDKLDAEDLRFYLMNSYKAFKALPVEKRTLPSLTTNP
jgi:hypothetical protein